MSVFDEANQDAYSIDPSEGAVAKRVGFLDNFEVGYNAQVRGSAMYGIEKAMHEMDAEQVDAMRRAGIEDVPKLSDDAFGFFGYGAFSGDYMDTARFYEDGGDPKIADALKTYDDKIDTLRKTYPKLNLRNSRDLWDETKRQAQSYEYKQQVNPTTFGGSVGGFLGGAIGGLNPESDPLNFATIPLAGGESALARVGFQGAAQGVAEGINQVTGVQEERRLLGLENGFADGLTRVAGAAVGGAVLQGAGEAIGAGARRFFRNTPSDPAPAFEPRPAQPLADTSQVPQGVIPADGELAASRLVTEPTSYMDYLKEVSPWSVSKVGKERTVLDMDYTQRTLDDWAGPRPYEMQPLVTAGRTARGDYNAPQPNIFNQVAEQSSVDALARRVDPDTFRIYDKHADDKAKYQARLDEFKKSKNDAVEQQLLDVNNRIDDLNEKISRSGAMKTKKLGAQVKELVTERERLKAQILASDNPEMSRMRQLAMRSDEKMRDLAPAVSRAYARARGKWDNTAAERAALSEMVRNGSKEIDPVMLQAATSDIQRVTPTVPETIYDKVPILRSRPDIIDALPARTDTTAKASAVVNAHTEVQDAAIETFRASIKKAIGDVEPKEGEELTNEITLPGQKYPLHLDDDKIVDDGVEYSIRQYLQKQLDNEDDLQAVTSCSIL